MRKLILFEPSSGHSVYDAVIARVHGHHAVSDKDDQQSHEHRQPEDNVKDDWVVFCVRCCYVVQRSKLFAD